MHYFYTKLRCFSTNLLCLAFILFFSQAFAFSNNLDSSASLLDATTSEDAKYAGGEASELFFMECSDTILVEVPPVETGPGPCNSGYITEFPPANSTCELGGVEVTLTGINIITGSFDVSNPGGICGPIHIDGFGTIELEFTAIDSCGNIATCSRVITRQYIDHRVGFVNCPQENIHVTVPIGTTSAVVEYPELEVKQTNCLESNTSIFVNLLFGLESGSEFPLGTTPIGYRVFSCYSFQSFCFFAVEVEEEEEQEEGPIIDISGFAPNDPDNSRFEMISIQPNPVSGDRLIFSVNSKVEGNYSYSIINALGMEVAKQNLVLFEGENNIEMDVSTLNAGVHYIHFPEGGLKNRSLKFIIAQD